MYLIEKITYTTWYEERLWAKIKIVNLYRYNVFERINRKFENSKIKIGIENYKKQEVLSEITIFDSRENE